MDRFKSLITWDKYVSIDYEEDSQFLNKINSYKINDILLLKNVLSPKECKCIINSSKNKFDKIDKEYLATVRNSKRLLTLNENLSNVVWKRINNFIKEKYYENQVTPFGFGTEGEWSPYYINECFRISEYNKGARFNIHRDACYVKNEDIRSIYTIIIYLNDNFQGGETIFYKTNKKRQMCQTVQQEMDNNEYKIKYSYKPKQGEVLIFDHDIIHEGIEVSNGNKYICRTDVVFERKEKPKNFNYDWRNNKNFMLCQDYYLEAGRLEVMGQVDKASELYEKGLSIRQMNR